MRVFANQIHLLLFMCEMRVTTVRGSQKLMDAGRPHRSSPPGDAFCNNCPNRQGKPSLLLNPSLLLHPGEVPKYTHLQVYPAVLSGHRQHKYMHFLNQLSEGCSEKVLLLSSMVTFLTPCFLHTLAIASLGAEFIPRLEVWPHPCLGQ